MLETIREFAVEQLERSGEASAIRGQHARWFAAFIEGAEAGVEGAEQQAWLDRIDGELPD
jgi:predicted ATPase